jgi:hypothetical protein
MKCECCLENKHKECYHEIELSVCGKVFKKKRVTEICKECLDVKDVHAYVYNSLIKYDIKNKKKYSDNAKEVYFSKYRDKYYCGSAEVFKYACELGYKKPKDTLRTKLRRCVDRGIIRTKRIKNIYEPNGNGFMTIFLREDVDNLLELALGGTFRTIKKEKLNISIDKKQELIKSRHLLEVDGRFFGFVCDETKESFCHECGEFHLPKKTTTRSNGKSYISYNWKCRDCIIDQYNNMSEKDKSKLLKKQREYNKSEAGKQAIKKSDKKRMQDPKHRFSVNIRKQLGKSFRENGWSKDTKTYKYIGATKEEFVEHMEAQFSEGMTWDNWTFDGWHLDHRLPLSAARTKEEVAMLWHKDNLQPMWAHENIEKRDKHCPKELEAYFEEKKVVK